MEANLDLTKSSLENMVLEAKLMAWWQAEAGLAPMAISGGDKDSTGAILSEEDEVDEVEALGECSIFEV